MEQNILPFQIRGKSNYPEFTRALKFYSRSKVEKINVLEIKNLLSGISSKIPFFHHFYRFLNSNFFLNIMNDQEHPSEKQENGRNSAIL